MQFTTVSAFISLVAVAAAATCTYGPRANIDGNALHDCLSGYRNGNWNGNVCGGRGWFKGGKSWNSPDDCYDACSGCVSSAIDQGYGSVQCDASSWWAQCWMGYH